ncbi:MAG TPA: 4Fe-4S dicluster domain-containing protein [Armatimonadota bacterium]|jgi:ferredoxin
MGASGLRVGDQAILEPQGLQALIHLLARSGYRVVGPTVRDGAIVYDEIASTEDLPVGWTVDQAPGSYRLTKRRDGAFFSFSVGSHSWKQFLHPPLLTLFRARRSDGRLLIRPDESNAPRFAFMGVRPCDLAAIAIQDRVLLGGRYANASYQARRSGAFLVAVNCGEPGGVCFCQSMGTGPKAAGGFDLALTEVTERKRHFFLVDVGSEAGGAMAAQIPRLPVEDEHIQAAERALARAADKMGRTLPTEGLKEALQQSYDHPRWEAVAGRCLTCGNCTAVCPTCFCTTVEDSTDLMGDSAERRLRWDSCFNVDFSYIFGGSVRPSAPARYRQWMLHKLATWRDQFGTPGCVGCGRCITWCPVGIDITEEARAIRAGEPDGKEQAHGNA